MTAFVAALGDPSLTIERAALLVGREFEPKLDTGVVLAALDGFARAYGAAAASDSAEQSALRLAGLLGGRLEFRGNTSDYYAPENSFLDRVVERRVGIPITLAVVYVAVGTRAGLLVEGVGFPGHFLVRVGGEGGVYLDPFHRGALLDDEKLRSLAVEFVGQGAEPSASHLACVAPRTVAIRMLTNLEAAYARRADHARSWVAADRLHALTNEPIFLRNRGLHAAAMGSHRLAVDDFEAYLSAHPTPADHARVEALVARSRGAAPRGRPN